MKITYTKLLLYFIVCCSLFTLSNCNDGCGEKEKINLIDLNRYVPYTGNDTLRFLRNNTDTQIFVGQGMERFYVGEGSPDGCPKDHESVRIRFKNMQNNNEIKMEYVFDENFSNIYSVNDYTYYKFFYKNNFLGNLISIKYSDSFIVINELYYKTIGLTLFSVSNDTLNYLYYRIPIDDEPAGILKIKYPGDTLTLIR